MHLESSGKFMSFFSEVPVIQLINGLNYACYLTVISEGSLEIPAELVITVTLVLLIMLKASI